MTDKELHAKVLQELEFDPSFDAAHVGVTVDKNVVSLTGRVGSYAEKLAVLAAVRRVKDVCAIVEHIDVQLLNDWKTPDDQIAKRALDMLKWNSVVSNQPIEIVVRDGWVTLSGSVNWHYERRAAEESVHKLSGVRGVTNNIVLKPSVRATDVKTSIESALRRQAKVEADAIRILVIDGDKVVLEGKVASWDARRAVEDAAWSTSGVATVDDRMTIG